MGSPQVELGATPCGAQLYPLQKRKLFYFSHDTKEGMHFDPANQELTLLFLTLSHKELDKGQGHN